jgi:hypothetical protein
MRLWSDEGETTSAPPRPAAVCSEVRALLALPPETAEQTCARHAREREAALLARAQVEALREARYAAPPETWVKLALATPGPYAEQLLWGLGAMADDTVITAAREPLCVLPGAFCVWGDSDLPCAGVAVVYALGGLYSDRADVQRAPPQRSANARAAAHAAGRPRVPATGRVVGGGAGSGAGQGGDG